MTRRKHGKYRYPRFPGGIRYRGRNRYQEFLSAAKTVTGKISRINGVVGILATGGLGRGYCDDYSDLDLIVYADDAKVREIAEYIAVGFMKYKGIDLDTPVESYQKALSSKSPSTYWSQVMRWDRENSQIMFDTANRIRCLLRQKLVFPSSEQRRLLREQREEVAEYLIHHFMAWKKRGRLANVSHALIHAAEHIILWIYAKNGRFQPYLPKWPFYHLENGAVPESRYFSLITKPYVAPIGTFDQAIRIREELLGVCEKIGLEFKYKTAEQIDRLCESRWKRASEKTKYYLSW